jgi:hypothetical protein
MRILEVIHLRMAGDDSEALAEFVQAAVEDAIASPEVRIYRHARMEGDLLVHLHHEESGERIQACELGVRLASVLRVHGLLDHSVWVRRDDPGRGEAGA